jgi:hypothetical protein
MLLKILYWLAVLAVSLALVIGLILFLESRDQSSIEGPRNPGSRRPDPGALPPHLPREDDHPLGGAVERVAGA